MACEMKRPTSAFSVRTQIAIKKEALDKIIFD